MILTSNEIRKQIGTGNIVIEPFYESRLNPNSYNLSLSNQIMYYDSMVLDMKKDEPYTNELIPETGYLLLPNRVYLAQTNERTKTYNYVPMIEGRSSVGRLGIFIHVTAGFGDIGFEGYWTLELSVIQPVKIYPNVEICQIYYHTVDGEIDKTYSNGKYQNNNGIQPSYLWKELTK